MVERLSLRDPRIVYLYLSQGVLAGPTMAWTVQPQTWLTTCHNLPTNSSAHSDHATASSFGNPSRRRFARALPFLLWYHFGQMFVVFFATPDLNVDSSRTEPPPKKLKLQNKISKQLPWLGESRLKNRPAAVFDSFRQGGLT